MNLNTGNLFSKIPPVSAKEAFELLIETKGLRVERIVSTGQQTPVGEWLAQAWDEWVVLLSGDAKLLIEGEAAPRDLLRGDWINIPAGVRHRVEWTGEDPPTVWLALHYNLK